MKRYKNLFHKIVTFENLYVAFEKAASGKKQHAEILSFSFHLEKQLYPLQEELNAQTYKPGAYKSFWIYDPKPRQISKAPFRDRVVHHALMNIIGPLLERSFIFDSYANRIGKGTHKAIRRYQHFSRRFNYALKCDIKKFFPSIDHEILKKLIARKIGCRRTLWLIEMIIDNSNEQQPVMDYFPSDDLFTPIVRRKGLPIGNLTSQFFANYYLNPLDHFVKEILRCRAYLRYVDDFVLFSDFKEQFIEWKSQIERFLENYRLKLNPNQCHIYPVACGRRFLGQVIFPHRRRLAAYSVRRFRQRLKNWKRQKPENLESRIAAWMGHAMQADTKTLLRWLHQEMASLISF